jgi:spore coat protein CotF
MPREISIKIEESLYKTLAEKTKEDIEELNKFVVKAIEEKLEKPEPTSLDTNGLGDFLSQAKQGSRNYGAKGQGW